MNRTRLFAERPLDAALKEMADLKTTFTLRRITIIGETVDVSEEWISDSAKELYALLDQYCQKLMIEQRERNYREFYYRSHVQLTNMMPRPNRAP